MNIKMLKAASAGLILSVSSFANAGLITSANDSALQGAEFIDFQTFAVGNYNSLDFNGGSFESNGAGNNYEISDSWNEYNDGQDRAFANWGDSNPFVLRFDSDVTAFGLTIGAINSNWSFALFDASDVLLDSFSILNGCCESRYIGFAENNIRYIQFSPTYDRAAFDSLSFINSETQPVPEPSTLAIFALGIMGLASRRFKKQ